MKRTLLAVLPLLALAVIGRAQAQDRSQQWDLCRLTDAHGNRRPDTNPDKAVAACTAIIQSGIETIQGLAVAFTARGVAYRSRGQYDLAIQDFDQALRLAPILASAYIGRGHTYDDKGQYDRAIQDLNQALRLDPDNADTYVSRGRVYNDKRQYDRAIEDYDEALRRDPKVVFGYNDRGYAYYSEGQYDRAIQDYDQALRLDPNSLVAYDNRGVAHDAEGQYDQAIQDFDEALRLDPNYVLGYVGRGNTYDGKGQYDRAIQDFDQALRLDPHNEWAARERGITKLYGRSAQEGAEDLRQAVTLQPRDAFAVIWLHIARVRAGTDDRAEFAGNMAALAAKKWPAQIAALFLGQTTETDVRNAAVAQSDNTGRRGNVCEADFFIGMLKNLNAQASEAKALLQRAAEECPLSYFESSIAKAELKRLGT